MFGLKITVIATNDSIRGVFPPFFRKINEKKLQRWNSTKNYGKNLEKIVRKHQKFSYFSQILWSLATGLAKWRNAARIRNIISC